MKRSVVYPDWAEKYRSKGRTIRKVRNGYGLYQCTSVYVPGQKYPKSVQKYLGMITEKDGFIPKYSSSVSSSCCLEYGLSHFIMANFKRDLERATYGSSMEIILLGIVLYLFGSADEVFIRSTYITHGMEDLLCERMQKGVSNSRLKTVSNRISSLIQERISDEKDRLILTRLLFLTVIGREQDESSIVYQDAVKDTAERYGLKL